MKNYSNNVKNCYHSIETYRNELRTLNGMWNCNYNSRDRLKVAIDTVYHSGRGYLLSDALLYYLVNANAYQSHADFIRHITKDILELSQPDIVRVISILVPYVNTNTSMPIRLGNIDDYNRVRDRLKTLNRIFVSDIIYDVNSAIFRMYDMDKKLDEKYDDLMKYILEILGAYAIFKKESYVFDKALKKYNYFRDNSELFTDLLLNGCYHITNLDSNKSNITIDVNQLISYLLVHDSTSKKVIIK